MDAATELRVATHGKPAVSGTPVLDPERRTHAALEAFRELAAALAEERSLDDLFHVIVDSLSRLTGADRCSLHLLDPDTGLFRGRAAHADRDIDDLVKQLVSGMPGDNFTREILETRRPVMLTNTMVDPRPVHAAMRRWRVQSVLGVPMTLRDEVIGILCLDTENTAMQFSRFDQELAIAFAELAATGINQVQLTARLRTSLDTQARQLEQLRRAHRMEDQLTDILLRGWGVRELGRSVAELLSKPCAIYDAEFRCLSYGGMTGDIQNRLRTIGEIRHHPPVADVLESLRAGQAQVIPPLRRLGIHHRLLVVSSDADGQRVGYVVIAETSGRFGPLDESIARRAAHSIALERSRNRLDDDMEWHAIEALTGSLLRGEHAGLESRARAFGIMLDAPRIVCLLGTCDGTPIGSLTPREAARRLTSKDLPSAVLAAWSGTDIALIVGVPESHRADGDNTWIKERLDAGLAAISPHRRMYAAVSSPVDRFGDDARAHRNAQQVLRCMREHLDDGTTTVLAEHDLGAARLLLSTADRDEAERLACDVLGPLLTERTVKSEQLLLTLDAFLRHRRNIRDSADELGVHANTVRYRLASVERRTRLPVSTDDDAYMKAQIVMTILRLGGRLGRARAAVVPRSQARPAQSRAGVDGP